MKTEINIEDYLSNEEMKEIAIEEFRSIVRAKIEGIKPDKRIQDYERIISNSVYYYLETEIDKLLGTDTQELIKQGVKKVLTSKDFSFSIFREKDAWRSEPSQAQKFFNEAVIDNKPIIQEKVRQAIDDYDFTDIHENIKEYILEVIEIKLKS
jgi:hypothetical protein